MKIEPLMYSTYSFHHLFTYSIYSLRSYFLPSTVLATEETKINKTVSTLQELTVKPRDREMSRKL